MHANHSLQPGRLQAFYEGADIAADEPILGSDGEDPDPAFALPDTRASDPDPPAPAGGPGSPLTSKRPKRDAVAGDVRSGERSARQHGMLGLHGRFAEAADDGGGGAGEGPARASDRADRSAPRGKGCSAAREGGRGRLGRRGRAASASPEDADPAARAGSPARRRRSRRRSRPGAHDRDAGPISPLGGAAAGDGSGGGDEVGGDSDAGGEGGFASLRHVSLYEREARRAVGRAAAAGAARRAGQWVSGAAPPGAAVHRPFAPPRARAAAAAPGRQLPPRCAAAAARSPDAHRGAGGAGVASPCAAAAGSIPDGGQASAADGEPGTRMRPAQAHASARQPAPRGAGAGSASPGARRAADGSPGAGACSGGAPTTAGEAAQPARPVRRLKARPGERLRTRQRGGAEQGPAAAEQSASLLPSGAPGAPAAPAEQRSAPAAAGLFQRFMFAARQ